MTRPSRPSQASSRAKTARPAEGARGDDPLADIDAAGTEPDRASPPGTPRWVKSFGVIAIVLVLLFVGLHVTGHVPTHTLPFSGAEHGMPPP